MSEEDDFAPFACHSTGVKGIYVEKGIIVSYDEYPRAGVVYNEQKR